MKKNLSLIVGLLILSCAFAQYPQLNNKNARIVMTQGSYLVLNDMALVNNGNFIQSAGMVKMTGIKNSFIAGTIKPQFFSLEIAKTGVAEIQLMTDFSVAKEISFVSGLLNLNNRNIFLLSTAILKGESDTRRIIGATGGYVEANALLNAPVNANPGNLGAFITSTKNLGNTIVRRGHQSQIIGGGNSNSLRRYYDITPAINTDLNASFRFQYFDAELNGINESNAVLFKKANNITWVSQGFTTRSAAANYVLKTVITDFSRWTISAPVNVPGRSTQPVTGNFINPNSTITKTTGPKTFIENLYPTIGPMQSVYIKTGNADIQKMRVMLYDMQGRLIQHQQINYQSQWVQLPQLLAAGIYKVVIQSGEWKYQQSFVKQ
jgi:hypothetical protein